MALTYNKIVDPDNLVIASVQGELGGLGGATGDGNIWFDTTNKLIYLAQWESINGDNEDLSDEGVATQCVYNFIKMTWNTDAYNKFAHPIRILTNRQFQLINGWDWGDADTELLLRDGGWAVRDTSNIIRKMNMVLESLGTFAGSGIAYYQQADGADPVDINLSGPVNQRILIYEILADLTEQSDYSIANGNEINSAGSDFVTTESLAQGDQIEIKNSANGNNGVYTIASVTANQIVISEGGLSNGADNGIALYEVNDYRKFFRIYLREYQETYRYVDLITSQNIEELTYERYQVSIENLSDANVDTVDGTVDTYGITITWFDPIVASAEADFSLSKRITITGADFVNKGYIAGQTLGISGSTSNDGNYEIETVAADYIEFVGTPLSGSETSESLTLRQTREIQSATFYPFSIIIKSDGVKTKKQIYMAAQSLMRKITDIDSSAVATKRGDIQDETVEYVGTTLHTKYSTSLGYGVFIDGYATADTNGIKFTDDDDVLRAFDSVATGTIQPNEFLQLDPNGKYWMYHLSTPGGDFGDTDAVVVTDNGGSAIKGSTFGQSSISWDFNYDNNTDGGRASGADADIVLTGNGLEFAQYVRVDGTIYNTTGNNFSMPANEELNWYNPS